MSTKNGENPQFSIRLKSERKRLGLTQDVIADACNTSKRTYCDYEKGTSEPRASFFDAFIKIGGDALFVITGQRSITDLKPDEAALLDNYRNAPEERKKTLREVGAALAEPDVLKSKKGADRL